MDVQELYRSKLMSARDAARLLVADSDVAMGMAVAEPPALLAEIARRIEARDLSALRLWYFHSMTHAAGSVLRRDLLDRVRPHCMFLSSVERSLMKNDPARCDDLIEFVPTAFSASPQLLREDVSLDACVTMVSPMGKHGYFTFGTANDYTSVAARAAKKLIVEVNPLMPRVFGESPLHVSEIDAIVENRSPLIAVGDRTAAPEDEAIAQIVAGMIDDGACLQMGIGNLPAAVCSRLNSRRDLGIHTELLTPALAGLMQCGAVNNRRKATFPGRSIFTFAMGDTPFYEWLDDNQAIYSLPVDLVNDPRHIAKNDNVVSVNATLQVDLSGACNSEHMMGHQYSGSGGQLDFVRGANASKGGISIIACRSTAKGGTVSRIVPRLEGPVTTPRNDVHWIVTEFGAANLRGKSLRERAEAMIALAHPHFRDKLAKAI
ncbi:acetyl-CoA hydrolase/transferase family protein [Novosphingobium sp. KN65.2]|uniref:acetyl-CoA hydrolase/transferase family protein n=1 Tax=Novosphingobium sp. KN65.2 TaxID=1478134 RepID=UPI0005E6ABE2|nr:acetyl-CoA hydrolase/transferase C-terminal domain-containing protein [Novosphingobium sp. KN65.2]CDO37092.1 Acetyl-CoA hydrolase/transferase [Novosphingobium sp. KN65.2]